MSKGPQKRVRLRTFLHFSDVFKRYLKNDSGLFWMMYGRSFLERSDAKLSIFLLLEFFINEFINAFLSTIISMILSVIFKQIMQIIKKIFNKNKKDHK